MVQKRSIKTDDLRTEDYMALSDKATRLYTDLKANATDSYGFITNVALSLLVCSRGGVEMEQAKEALQELIQAGYLYDFGGGIYLVMSFQRDNALEYLKTTQPTAPELLTYIYIDVNTNMYKLSATPVRSKDGWTGKIKTNQGKDYQGKDNVPPRKYLFEDKIEDGYTIVPFDIKLDWSQHEAIAKGNNDTQQQQSPSNQGSVPLQPQAQAVAPQPQAPVKPSKQTQQAQQEIAQLNEQDNADSQDNNNKASVNPFTATKDGQQQREALDKQYATVGAQTRSLDGVEEPQPQYKDVGLTAEQQREFRANPPEEDDSLPF